MNIQYFLWSFFIFNLTVDFLGSTNCPKKCGFPKQPLQPFTSREKRTYKEIKDILFYSTDTSSVVVCVVFIFVEVHFFFNRGWAVYIYVCLVKYILLSYISMQIFSILENWKMIVLLLLKKKKTIVYRDSIWENILCKIKVIMTGRMTTR